jgi:ribosomal protein L11 methyltransferase
VSARKTSWVWTKRVPKEAASAWLTWLGALDFADAAIIEKSGGASAELMVVRPKAHDLRPLRSLGGVLRRWQPAAEQGLKAFTVAGRVEVVPSDEAVAQKDKLIRLAIPAGPAFGTGHHATTRLCLARLIERIGRRQGLRVLDVGTGTGLLALAASALGAEVVGMDNDPDAIREARRNQGRNPHAGRVRWVCADVAKFQMKPPAEVVVANLFADLLEHHAARIASWVAPGGGVAILSGMLDGQEVGVIRAWEKVGARLERRWRSGKWICLRMGF